VVESGLRARRGKSREATMRDDCERCGGELPFSGRGAGLTFVDAVAASLCNACRNEVDEAIRRLPEFRESTELAAEMKYLEAAARGGADTLGRMKSAWLRQLDCVGRLAPLVRAMLPLQRRADAGGAAARD
jgi:hypothetical protein